MGVSAFGEPTGEGWTQVGELAIAFVLALLIGLEREAQQKSAGMRTYPLVGLGSALWVLVSKYGFTDVLGANVSLDPSRVTAQIVSGLGFIGAGLIFVRRDSVRGLTTAASVWLTAAVGAAAAAGLPVLATLTVALYFVLLYALRPLATLVRRVRPDAFVLRVRYLDGRGVLRDVIDCVTRFGYAIAELTTVQTGTHMDPEADEWVELATVEVTLVLSGRGDFPGLSAELAETSGVLGVRSGPGRGED